jgi:hypothetical protein
LLRFVRHELGHRAVEQASAEFVTANDRNNLIDHVLKLGIVTDDIAELFRQEPSD